MNLWKSRPFEGGFQEVDSTWYWTAIVLSSVISALGHLVIVFLAVAEPVIAAILYIIFANSIGGLIFDYVYWRKG